MLLLFEYMVVVEIFYLKQDIFLEFLLFLFHLPSIKYSFIANIR